MDYEGTCYIGIVGGDHEIPECRDSIHNLKLRPGDSSVYFQRGTKGYENRERHIRRFLESEHDFIFLMDHDQTFPADALERLRSHKLPYVSGYYMRRMINPIAPVWFEEFDGKWPMTPWTREPERGKLHKLGASGWGCILIHRAVFEAVAEVLKGESFVLEDDMDIWPYNLERIMATINRLDALASSAWDLGDLKAGVYDVINVLREEIRPLRCIKNTVGSDIRFPFFAAAAGFDLYGDPDVRCGHAVSYFVSPDDYSNSATPDYQAKLRDYLSSGGPEERAQIAAALEDMAYAGAIR
jgi:hypothetical protein